MEKIVEGRRSNVVYILGQIKGFLETLKGIEGYNIASIHDIVARQFAQALSEAGASDPYAVIRAVDEVSRVRGTGPIYTRIYRKYFHAPVTMSPEEANVAAEQGFEDGVEEISDEEDLEGAEYETEDGPYADDLDDADVNLLGGFRDPEEDKDWYGESRKFIEGKDNFSKAYESATELLRMDGWTREAVEVYLRDEYKLIPEDVNAIIDSVVRMQGM